MLIINVTIYQHLTKVIEKLKNLKASMNFLSEIDDRKEQEEEKIFFKTNVLVPKKSV